MKIFAEEGGGDGGKQERKSGNITLGSSLVASVNSPAWRSPSGDFAFGFHRIEGQKLYLLGIWFDKIRSKTLAWYANGDELAPEGSKLRAKNRWSAHSRDTEKSLSSRTAENNFSRGHFGLRLIRDCNLVLNTIALPKGNAYEAYFWSNTIGTKSPNVTGNRLIFNKSARNYYYSAILEYDGVFTQYAHLKASRNGKWEERWSRVWSKQDDICSAIQGQFGLGTCGFNSYCMLVSNGRPNCKCLPGFNFSDPSNEFKGCECDPIQRFNLDDTNLQDLYDMYTIDNIFWPNSSNYEELQFFNQDEFWNSCLFDSNCVVQ
ncbi:G-type lectin S-receptor-like serine/threonine-protein kinase LECRK3 [Lycium barbarum]|uniref:G-type lectin S-receptor-like serine/threonine-protein kinase LECRK3 n=1 Tax=Lycium barbarum TaxID=112863 RepID=UPI00293EE09B|nr:G-type lectin S-receptor-like serine/threonine-protein kinase LECRK3 [Lycium barbarum]